MGEEDEALQPPVPTKKASCWTPEEVRGSGDAARTVCVILRQAGRLPHCPCAASLCRLLCRVCRMTSCVPW